LNHNLIPDVLILKRLVLKTLGQSAVMPGGKTLPAFVSVS
jgi:hypothetical protein